MSTVSPLPPFPMTLCPVEVLELGLAFSLPPLPVEFALLQLPLSRLHCGKRVVGRDAIAFSLYSERVLVAPDVFRLHIRKDSRGNIGISMLVGSIPWRRCLPAENIVVSPLAFALSGFFIRWRPVSLATCIYSRRGDKLQMPGVVDKRCIVVPI